MLLCKAGKTDLEDKIKQLNPFLEAFGNAKTVMNDNSSRFGKYLELSFDTLGNICGAQMLHYLLEKSRVAFRNEGEQTFHIFYQLYAGMQAANKLGEYGLTKPSDNWFLNNPPGPSDESVLNSTLKTCGEGT
jgi:myosin heavy subunit